MSTDMLLMLASLLGMSLTLSLILTPLIRAVALRVGLVDKPDGRRKLHPRIIPVAGGLGILVSAVTTLFVAFCFLPAPLGEYLRDGQHRLVGLLLGATAICAVGVADDFRRLRARHKLMGQLVAVGTVLAFGVRVEGVVLFGLQIDLGWLALPFTAFWLLGAINSLNLIDGMDGLLGSIGAIVTLAIAVLAALHNQWVSACVAVALGGSILGFLRYNLPPASIFLGDAGSMLIGLVVGVLAIQSSLKSSATVALAAPAALLVIPIFDTAAAIIRRKLTGRSICSTDRGHLHHCMLNRGLSRPRVLLVVSGLCLVTVVGVLASQAFQNEVLALLSAAVVVAILILTRLFGHAEFLLVVKRCSTLARSLTTSIAAQGHQVVVHLQGSIDWTELWPRLTARAEQLNLKSVQLDVNAPAIHEGYHARWYGPGRSGGFEEHDLWHTELPLTASGQVVGRLELTGWNDEQPVWAKVAGMAVIVDQIEARLANLTSAHGPAREPARSQALLPLSVPTAAGEITPAIDAVS